MRSQLHTYEIAEGTVRSAFAEQLKRCLTEVAHFSEENLNLTFKKEELARAEKVLERITDRQIALQTEKSAPERVVWHQPAIAPAVPVEALPYRNMVLAGLLAFCFPYAAGLFALVLWNLGKLIRKLEPAETDAVVRGGDSKPQDPD
jgi:hypothetical protein